MHLIVCPRATLLPTRDKWIAGGRVAAVVSGAYCVSSNFSGPVGRRVPVGTCPPGGAGWIIEPEEGEVLGVTTREAPFLTAEIDLASGGVREVHLPALRCRMSNEFGPAPVKSTATIEDLDRLDIRVGTVLRVEDVPKSSKLVKLVVSFGDHERQILAGIKAEREDPGELEGHQALFVVNLEPRTMAGELSEGMLFDIGYADGIVPVLAKPERPVPDGSRLG